MEKKNKKPQNLQFLLKPYVKKSIFERILF